MVTRLVGERQLKLPIASFIRTSSASLTSMRASSRINFLPKSFGISLSSREGKDPARSGVFYLRGRVCSLRRLHTISLIMRR